MWTPFVELFSGKRAGENIDAAARVRPKHRRRRAVAALVSLLAFSVVASLMTPTVDASITNNQMTTFSLDTNGNFIPYDSFGREEPVFVQVTTSFSGGGWLCIRKEVKKFADHYLPCAKYMLRPVPAFLNADYVPVVAPEGLPIGTFQVDGFGTPPKKGVSLQSRSNQFQMSGLGCIKGGNCDKNLQVFMNHACTMGRRSQMAIGQSALFAIVAGAGTATLGLVIATMGPAGIALGVGLAGTATVFAVANSSRRLAQTAKTYWEGIGNCQASGAPGSAGGARAFDPYAGASTDYTTIAQPVFQPFEPSADPLLAAGDQAWQVHLAYVRAVSETIEHLNAAKAAGDGVAVTRQERALADYSSKLSEAVEDTALAQEDLATAVAPTAADTTLNAQQIADAVAMRDRIVASGFTADEIDQLHTSGLNDIEIAEARTELATVEPFREADEYLTDAMNYTAGDMGIESGFVADLSEAMSTEAGPAPTTVVANPDAATTAQGQPTPIDVVANDDVPLGSLLTVTDYDQTSTQGGTVACSPGGDCTYTPAVGFAGTDTFTYTAHSDGLADATATVTVTVTAAPPTATADDLTTAMNMTANVDVLTNDVVPPGSTLSVTAFDATTAGGGSVSCTPQGTCTFTPPADVVGTDSFSYTVSTNQGATAVGVVSISVLNAIGPPPVARNDKATTTEAAPVSLDVFANDSAPAGSSLHVIDWQTTTANNGTATCSNAGSCTYTPDPSFIGSDTFGYMVVTDGGKTDTAIVTVTVKRAAPTGVDDDARVLSGTPITVDVLANDIGAPGTSLTVSLADATSVEGGTVTCLPNGDCTYRSVPGFFGNDSFAYTVATAAGTTATATVNLVVDEKPNGIPVATDDNIAASDSVAFDILTNDSDPDAELVHVVRVGDASHGKVTCDSYGNGGCLYNPDAGYSGPDEFTYDISDGRGGVATATVRIGVTLPAFVNHAPIALGDALGTSADEPGTVDVIQNDTDQDGHGLIVSSWTDGVHGTVTCIAGGTCTYTPAAGYSGFDLFSYGIDDGNGGTSTGTVLVSVSSGTASLGLDVTGVPAAGGSGPVMRGEDGLWHIGTSILPADLPQELAAKVLPATIDLTTTGAHRIDPESVRIAKGWTVDPTGTHYTAGPGSLVGSSAVNVLGMPAPPISQGSGGDGHVPIMVGSRMFAFFHHSSPTSVTCVDLVLNRPCPGYPKRLNMFSSDLNGPGAVVGSKIYVHLGYSQGNAQTAPVTMFCWDAATDETCGMINVGRIFNNLTPNTSPPIAVDGKVYLAADTGDMYCYDPATQAACAIPSVATGLGATLGKYYDIVTHGTVIYVSRSDLNLVVCFDATSMTPCAGWEGGPEQFGGWNLVTRHDATGAATGVCVAVAYSPLVCVDDGNPDVREVSAVNWPAVEAYWTATEEAETGTKTFFGRHYYIAGLGCWDWAIEGPCTGGGFEPGGYISTNSNGTGLPVAYGAVFDGECVVAVGDSGLVFTVDPVGSAPCSRSNTSASRVIDLRDQRVDGGVGTATWTSVVVGGANLDPDTDFRSFVVTVRDGVTGELLLEQQMIGSSGVIDISGIDAAAHPALVVGARFASSPANPAWADGDPPRLVLNWEADPSQVEVRTIAEGSCVKTPEAISLIATVADPAATGAGGLTTAGTGCVPLAFAVLETTAEDASVSASFSASDADSDPLTYRILVGPDHGATSAVTGTGLTYTPDPNYNGIDAITYVTNDGNGDSAPSQIVVIVTPVNDTPVSDPAAASTIENVPVDLSLTGSDIDADPLTFRVVTPPAHGTLSGGVAAGSVTYTPDAGYVGADTFEFVANDGTADSPTAVAQLTVQADPTTTTTTSTTSTTTAPTSTTSAPTSTTSTGPTSTAGPAFNQNPNAIVSTTTSTVATTGTLPATGGNTLSLVMLALGLTLAGAAVLAVRRRRAIAAG